MDLGRPSRKNHDGLPDRETLMDRIAKARTFTCKGCGKRSPRSALAMSTSQAGLCRGCYDEDKRIYIYWIGQFAYLTGVGHKADFDDPNRPRGAHNEVQMSAMAQGMDGKRLRYQDLIA